ncbi:hypothetical protein BELL_0958g00060 [Botrytis elliptica]|uniref:Uncharacterized protein n=1 Tax=Botrytis elliptica TaxID=278938 RepID=A0A4Z1J4A9_9HELO|nr:hypothetical protein BELL_0958g00060 [Botrytis elliptica]
MFDEKSRGGIELQLAIIVGGVKRSEEAMRDGEERHVRNIGIVFGGIRHNVMDVVIALPPAEGEPPEKIGHENPNAAIGVKAVRDAHVSGIVGGEDELVPEESEEQPGERIVCALQTAPEERKENAVANRVDAVGTVRTFVKSRASQRLIQLPIFQDNLLLGFAVQRGIPRKIDRDGMRGQRFRRHATQMQLEKSASRHLSPSHTLPSLFPQSQTPTTLL